MGRVVVATDSFPSSIDSGWTNPLTGNNALAFVSAGSIILNSDSAVNAMVRAAGSYGGKQWSKVTLGIITTGGGNYTEIGPACMVDSSTGAGYFAAHVANLAANDEWRVYYRDGIGGETQIAGAGTTSTSYASGTILTLEVDDAGSNNVRLYADTGGGETLVAQATHGTLTIGRPGIHGYKEGGPDTAEVLAWSGGILTDLSLTDVDTDEVVEQEQTGAVWTGTGLGTTNVDRRLYIGQDGIEVDQVETGTGTSTTATATIGVFGIGDGDILFGDVNFGVELLADNSVVELAGEVIPPSGQFYVVVETPYPDPDSRISAVPDIEAGDQIWVRGVGGGAAPTGLTVYSDGSFGFDDPDEAEDFEVAIGRGDARLWGDFALQSIESGSSELPVGLCLETDVCLGLGKAKRRSTGACLETDVSLSLGRSKRRAVGLCIETDVCLGFGHSFHRGTGACLETDTPLPLGRVKSKSVGLCLETDVCLGLARRHARAAGACIEVDVSLALGRVKRRAVGICNETDTCVSLGSSSSAAAGRCDEVDTCLGLGRKKVRAVSVCLESDTCVGLTGSKHRSLGACLETDTCVGLSPVSMIGVCEELDYPLTLGRKKVRSVGRCDETDVCVGLIRAKHRATGACLEVDTALALGKTKRKSLSRSDEVDTCLGPTAKKGHTTGLCLESDGCLTLGRIKRRSLGRSNESDYCLALLENMIIGYVGLCEEVDICLPLVPGFLIDNDTEVDLGSFGAVTLYGNGSKLFTLSRS